MASRTWPTTSPRCEMFLGNGISSDFDVRAFRGEAREALERIDIRRRRSPRTALRRSDVACCQGGAETMNRPSIQACGPRARAWYSACASAIESCAGGKRPA